MKNKICTLLASILSVSLASVVLILLCSAKTVKIAPQGEVLATSTISPSVELSPEQVREYVATQAQKAGVNVQKALWTLHHESQDGQRMIGDDGICHDPRSINYGKETQSMGYFMINNCYHPEISEAFAMNLTSSTRFFLSSVLAGRIYEWTSMRDCRKLYKDCPF